MDTRLWKPDTYLGLFKDQVKVVESGKIIISQ